MSKPIEFSAGANLFIDDYLIAESIGLTRNTHQPNKRTRPVLGEAESWHRQPQWFLEVERDPGNGRFRAWYNLKNFLHGGGGGQPAICYAYAESEDGVHWIRPDLGLVEAEGSRRNNIIDAPLGHFGLFLIDAGAGCAEPSRRYRMAYSHNGLALAFSADGLRFTVYPGNPVIPASSSEIPFPEPGHENSIGDIIDGCLDPLRDEYLLGCKVERDGYPGKPHHHAEGWRRCVGMSTSRDFLNWERPRLILTPDPGHGIEEFYGFKPTVRGNLYLGFLRVLRDDLPATPGGPVEGIGWTELLTSRDGRNWTRHPEPFIDRDLGPGSWDHAMAWYADCVTVGDQEYVYYGGYTAGHKVGEREIGLGILRKDGFVSRDAGNRTGFLRTPPATLPGSAMTVNAVVRGELQVRLLDANGRTLPGFDQAAALPVRGDSVAHRIEWRDQRPLPQGQAVSIEFSLQQAQLYEFAFCGQSDLR